MGASSADDLAARYDNYRAVGVRYVVVGLGALETPGFAPLAAEVDRPGAPYRRAYRGGAMEILELSQPASYFEAPGCTLRPLSRDRVAVDCHAPSRLRRLELYMPGWRARVGGSPAEVVRSAPIFQEVALPAGASTVVFEFWPRFMTAALATALASLLGLGVYSLWPRRN